MRLPCSAGEYETSDRPLRVVHCVGFYFPDSTGSTEVYVRDLVAALSRRSVDSTIIAATDGAYERYTWQGIDVVRYPIDAAEVRHNPDAIGSDRRSAFQRIVASSRPDIFHLHSWTGGAGLPHLRQVARLGIPGVVTMHALSALCMRSTMLLYDKGPCDGRIDDRRCARCWALYRGLPGPAAHLLAALPRWDAADSTMSRFSTRAASLLSSRASAATKARELRSMATLSERIVAPSEWMRAALALNGIQPEKIVVSGQAASDGFATRKPRPLKRLDGRGIVVGFLDHLEPCKGAYLLVRALARLPIDLPVQLRIAATGQDVKYARLIEAAASKDPRIGVVGLVEHEQVLRFLEDIDVLAVPSRCMETGPIVVQEARALGIPVMGASIGGIAERVTDGVDGWLLPFDDPQPWADAMLEAATDLAKVARLSDHMRRVRSTDDVANEMAALYRSIVEKRELTRRAHPRA